MVVFTLVIVIWIINVETLAEFGRSPCNKNEKGGGGKIISKMQWSSLSGISKFYNAGPDPYNRRGRFN